MTFRRSRPGWIPRLAALLPPLLAAWGCATSGAPPTDPGLYEAAARARLAREGLEAARVVVAGPADWRPAADASASVAEALARLGWSGLRVESRGGSFCARARGAGDCLFVSVEGPPGTNSDLGGRSPSEVEAVAWAEPSVPDGGRTPMAWREELRTGWLVFFLEGW